MATERMRSILAGVLSVFKFAKLSYVSFELQVVAFANYEHKDVIL